MKGKSSANKNEKTSLKSLWRSLKKIKSWKKSFLNTCKINHEIDSKQESPEP